MRKIVPISLLISVATLLPVSVQASTISGVGGARVQEGKLSTGVRLGYAQDGERSSQDNRLRSRTHIDYGVTDHYAARIVFAVDKREGDNLEAERLGFENRFHILKRENAGFDLGARLNYTYRDGDKKPDNVSVRFYQEIPIDNWDIRFNQIFNHDVGQNSIGGVSMELRSQAVYKLSEQTRIGIESFNDFRRLNDLSGYSTQDHDLGPVVKGKLGNGLSYEVGYRAGISDFASDHNFKLFFSKSF